ncbi:MAG TPA: tetratricopeptide repeat protein [Chthoniobacterales bacterium]
MKARFFLLAAVVALAAALILIQTKPQPRPAPASSADSQLLIISEPLPGDDWIDQQIRRIQQGVRKGIAEPERVYELGCLFLKKARLSHDPGFYTLAEQTALWLQGVEPEFLDARLLEGHVRLAQHRFKQAESVARSLTTQRETMLDYALLGDALLDQGRLQEAVAAYQKMIDFKPCLPSYCRVAQVRWLTGDRDGAEEMLRQAINTGSARDPEPLAWATTRLAVLDLERHQLEDATHSAGRALELVPEYAPALFAQGRVAIARDDTSGAVTVLERAAHRQPLPEYQWLLADALRLAQQRERATEVETALARQGRTLDRRTFALYLATRGDQLETALTLAWEELGERQDVFTHDAVAWCAFRTGDLETAKRHASAALREGTRDARLALHAGLIFNATGDGVRGQELLSAARDMAATLFPSERTLIPESVVGLTKTNNP